MLDSPPDSILRVAKRMITEGMVKRVCSENTDKRKGEAVLDIIRRLPLTAGLQGVIGSKQSILLSTEENRLPAPFEGCVLSATQNPDVYVTGDGSVSVVCEHAAALVRHVFIPRLLGASTRTQVVRLFQEDKGVITHNHVGVDFEVGSTHHLAAEWPQIYRGEDWSTWQAEAQEEDAIFPAWSAKVIGSHMPHTVDPQKIIENGLPMMYKEMVDGEMKISVSVGIQVHMDKRIATIFAVSKNFKSGRELYATLQTPINQLAGRIYPRKAIESAIEFFTRSDSGSAWKHENNVSSKVSKPLIDAICDVMSKKLETI
ncbi:hypothetical protein COY07_06205 [Candidatus Peregrinibacteria bacterium CG_4_10_14_0_2_um_filter_43_11]|nr:MAG: hypothetical protein COY07_06205 [Candidatus Peregrinibacteria bacterium CG_4_10_14_0_2_um_filter_43_11]